MVAILTLPPKLDQSSAVAFCKELAKVPEDAPIVVDASKIRWAFPFGSLVVASQLRRRMNAFRCVTLVGYNGSEPSHTYLAHIGFFRTVGADFGNDPGKAAGSAAYLPITVLSQSDLLADEIIGDHPVQRAIQRKSNQMAQVLSQSNQLKVTRPIAYCFRELIRNVFEHSASDECMIAAQSYSDGRVLLGVVDYGQGLKKSLSERYTPPSDLDAVRLALRPGISRNAGKDDDDDVWANSGFGLYVLSELGRRNGYFSIMSGTALFELGEKSAGVRDCDHNGTAINVVFRKQPGMNLEEQIEGIIAEGEKITAIEGRASRASKKSHMTE